MGGLWSSESTLFSQNLPKKPKHPHTILLPSHTTDWTPSIINLSPHPCQARPPRCRPTEWPDLRPGCVAAPTRSRDAVIKHKTIQHGCATVHMKMGWLAIGTSLFEGSRVRALREERFGSYFHLLCAGSFYHMPPATLQKDPIGVPLRTQSPYRIAGRATSISLCMKRD